MPKGHGGVPFMTYAAGASLALVEALRQGT